MFFDEFIFGLSVSLLVITPKEVTLYPLKFSINIGPTGWNFWEK